MDTKPPFPPFNQTLATDGEGRFAYDRRGAVGPATVVAAGGVLAVA